MGHGASTVASNLNSHFLFYFEIPSGFEECRDMPVVKPGVQKGPQGCKQAAVMRTNHCPSKPHLGPLTREAQSGEGGSQ